MEQCVPASSNGMFKTLTNSCSRLLQIDPVMLNYFSISYICLHSLDVFLRKHFVRLRCKLTHSSCYRFVFDSIFSVGKYFVRMFHAHRICKPNRRTKYLTPVKYRTDVKAYKKGGGKLSTKKFFCLLVIFKPYKKLRFDLYDICNF